FHGAAALSFRTAVIYAEPPQKASDASPRRTGGPVFGVETSRGLSSARKTVRRTVFSEKGPDRGGGAKPRPATVPPGVRPAPAAPAPDQWRRHKARARK